MTVMKTFIACLLVSVAFFACGGDDAAEQSQEDTIDAAAQADAEADVESALKNAATAQETHYVDNMTYTTSVGDLEDAGLEVNEGVTLEIPEATVEIYCIMATHEDLESTYVLESTTLDVNEGTC